MVWLVLRMFLLCVGLEGLARVREPRRDGTHVPFLWRMVRACGRSDDWDARHFHLHGRRLSRSGVVAHLRTRQGCCGAHVCRWCRTALDLTVEIVLPCFLFPTETRWLCYRRCSRRKQDSLRMFSSAFIDLCSSQLSPPFRLLRQGREASSSKGLFVQRADVYKYRTFSPLFCSFSMKCLVDRSIAYARSIVTACRPNEAQARLPCST